MKVDEVTPLVDSGALLPGAQFADAYCVAVDNAALDARHAAERTIGRQPQWAQALLVLRNFLVAPFGLKTSGASEIAPKDMIGIFPVISETPDRLVAGFNDRHLDFRVVVDVASSGTRQSAAQLEGRSLTFAHAISRVLWDGSITGWNEGDHLASAASAAGFNLAAMDAAITTDPDRYERVIAANEQDHAASGHWGVPTFAFENEPFFGQDRIELLVWRMESKGLSRREK
jgi:hypothetical protein